MLPVQRYKVVGKQALLVFDDGIRKFLDLLLTHAILMQRLLLDQMIQKLL